MKERVKNNLLQQHMIQAGDTVLVACSGGADSMALLLVLLDLKDSMDISLEVIHVEHGIRGEESLADAGFVEAFCRKHQLVCHVKTVDVLTQAKVMGLGVEETARRLRYDAIRHVARERGIQRVALAHHANDQAETVLLHLTRGSGLKGLRGMLPMREWEGIWFLRPMLGITREEIEQYLLEKGQAYRTDATNLDTTYHRNRLRAEVVPQLKGVNPKAISHIEQTAQRLQEIWEVFDEVCTKQEQRLFVSMPEGVFVSVKELETLPVAVQQELLLRAMYRTAGCERDFSQEHVLSVAKLLTKQSGRRVCLPYQVVAYTEYDKLCFILDTKQQERSFEENAISSEALALLENARESLWIDVAKENARIELSVFSKELLPKDFKKKAYTKYVDYDKIKDGFSIRTRQEGDYLVLDSMGKRKKLSNYFVDEKVPASKRDEVLLLAKGQEVVCLLPGRMSYPYLVDDTTTKVLSVSYIGG